LSVLRVPIARSARAQASRNIKEREKALC